MTVDYNYKNCQSLFGYAYTVHLRSGGICQLCGAGETGHSFDLWRQLTVEHLIGKKQGGYLKDIRKIVNEVFPELEVSEQSNLAGAIDAVNTVTACSFCNSSTSRDKSSISMKELVASAAGKSRNPIEIVEMVSKATQEILKRKRADVDWKLKSIRSQYDKEFLPAVAYSRVTDRKLEG